METFGSLENVKNTKYELIEALSGGGTAIFSSDNEDTKRLYELTKKKKILAGINGKEVRAKGVKVTGQGTEFTLVIGRDKYYLKTKLLGRHNVTNICLAAAAAKELGVSPRRIAAAVERLKPPEHRLQPFVTANGVTVIDDGYNANIDGVRNAAETLKEIAGRKFAVVSGIAEGGSCSRELNEEVGKLLKDAVNVLIATGVYADYIFAGARGGDCKVLKAKDLASAENILKTRVVSGDTVIFINDLPDNY